MISFITVKKVSYCVVAIIIVKKHNITGIAEMICESYNELGKNFPNSCNVPTNIRVLTSNRL